MMKQKVLGGAIILCAGVLLVGCQTTTNYAAAVDSWQGQHANALAHSWGKPNKIVKQKQGKQQWIYYARSRDVMPTLNATPPQVSRVRTISGNMGLAHHHPITTKVSQNNAAFSCATTFDINSKGLITNTHFQGAHCVATKSDVKEKGFYVGG